MGALSDISDQAVVLQDMLRINHDSDKDPIMPHSQTLNNSKKTPKFMP